MTLAELPQGARPTHPSSPLPAGGRLNLFQGLFAISLTLPVKSPYDFTGEIRGMTAGGGSGPGYWFPVTGSRLLVPGYWFPVTGSRLLVPGYWFPATGSRLLVPGYWFPLNAGQTKSDSRPDQQYRNDTDHVHPESSRIPSEK